MCEATRAGGYAPIPAETEQVAKAIVSAAYKVHGALGPGLLESVYETCLEYELRQAGLRVDRQVDLPVVYSGIQIDAGFRLDLLVDDRVIVELKAVEMLSPLHTAQLLTYLRLTGRRLGFLINFNVSLIREGLHRIVL